MRRQNIVWLGATVAMLSLAACFSDPTKSLRSGPSRLVVTELAAPNGRTLQNVGTLTYADINVNDTLILGIQVQDNQGNYFSFSAPTLGSGSAAIAALAAFPDTVLGTVPGNTLWKALLIGASSGSTTVTIQADGVSDTVKVTVN